MKQTLFADLSTQLLSHGRSVRFCAPGRSMHPTIRDDEIITVEPVLPEAVRVDDIILYRIEDIVIAHRVRRVVSGDGSPHSFILQGDASPACDDPVDAGQILGRVICVERAGRSIDLCTRRAKWFHRAYATASHLKKKLRDVKQGTLFPPRI